MAIMPIPVPSVAGVSVAREPIAGAQVKCVLEMFIFWRVERGWIREGLAEWLDAVLSKLLDINLTTLRELMVAAPKLNSVLYHAHHRRLHELTITEMMSAVALMIDWPGNVAATEGSGSDAS